ncbi:LuxR C-terminal-related transcriptional regulator, partial [Catenibacterium sp.]
SELWSGMGRAVNNLTAAIIASPVLALLSSDSNLSAIILILVLFVAVSIVSVIYTVWKNDFIKQQTIEVIDEKEKLRRFSELYSFTDRETEVFEQLVNTEDSIQVIAENIYVSKRTLERYVSAIYEKTGVKSRIGLLNLYNK